MHRGPYKWTADRKFVICEKFSTLLAAWVPFAALVDGTEDDPHDAPIAEDIYNKIQRGVITPEEPPAADIEAERAEWCIAPVQFRRGLREWEATDGRNWRTAFDNVALSEESRDELEYGLAVERTSASFVELVEMFGWTDEHADAFFKYCLAR